MTDHRDPHTFKKPVTFEDAVTFGAALTPPTNTFFVKRWVSAELTEADLVGGQASQALAVADFPAGCVPIAAYTTMTTAPVSGDAGTTTFTISLGVSGSAAGFLAAGVNLIGAGTGRKQHAHGTLLNSYRSADSLLATVTAGGSGPDLVNITALGFKVVVYYLEVATE